MPTTTYSLQTFDAPGALETRAYGINDSGQIVGTYSANRTPPAKAVFRPAV